MSMVMWVMIFPVFVSLGFVPAGCGEVEGGGGKEGEEGGGGEEGEEDRRGGPHPIRGAENDGFAGDIHGHDDISSGSWN